MPNEKEPNSGLFTFENLTAGDGGWAGNMVANWQRLGRVGFHLSIIDRDLTSPPGSPADGDRYIVGGGATGDWAGEDDNIAVFDADASTAGEWVFYTPSEGWVAYIEDEEKLSAYKGASVGWSAGIAI